MPKSRPSPDLENRLIQVEATVSALTATVTALAGRINILETHTHDPQPPPDPTQPVTFTNAYSEAYHHG